MPEARYSSLLLCNMTGLSQGQRASRQANQCRDSVEAETGCGAIFLCAVLPAQPRSITSTRIDVLISLASDLENDTV